MAYDRLYAHPRLAVSDFVFDEQVADVFEDMIRRSVPGYRTIVHMIGILAQRFAKANSRCYDLGCSLGTVTLSMLERMTQKGVRVVAVDNSPAMAAKCHFNVKDRGYETKIDVVCSDIRDVKIEQASVVVLNFTLQFIDPYERDELIKRFYKGLIPGGVLVISEKIVFMDEQEQAIQEKLYHDFKKDNGYSELEIAQKRSALEKVLVPDTLPEHLDRLRAGGFNDPYVWFKCLNFVSMVAFK